MKYYLLLGLLFAFISAYTQEERKVEYDKLTKKGNKYYYKNESKAFTGKCYTTYKSGEKGMAGSMTEGIRSGHWVWWYKNGEKQRVAKYKNGKKNGKCIFYYKNGIKKSEIIFDNNRNIRQQSWNKKGERIKNPSFNSFR